MHKYCCEFYALLLMIFQIIYDKLILHLCEIDSNFNMQIIRKEILI